MRPSGIGLSVLIHAWKRWMPGMEPLPVSSYLSLPSIRHRIGISSVLFHARACSLHLFFEDCLKMMVASSAPPPLSPLPPRRLDIDTGAFPARRAVLDFLNSVEKNAEADDGRPLRCADQSQPPARARVRSPPSIPFFPFLSLSAHTQRERDAHKHAHYKGCGREIPDPSTWCDRATERRHLAHLLLQKILDTDRQAFGGVRCIGAASFYQAVLISCVVRPLFRMGVCALIRKMIYG